MNNKLCPHSTFVKSGARVMLLCRFTDIGCAVARWCMNDECYKMTDRYPSGCKYVNKEVCDGIQKEKI
jgi:hypothetical protein